MSEVSECLETLICHTRHNATVEPSQRWHDDEEDRENNTDDYNDPNAGRQCAEHVLNRLYPNSQ